MRLIDEVKIKLEKYGYELIQPESKRYMVNNKEIVIRYADDDKVELEPHIFEAEDIEAHLSEFKVREHDPDVLDIETGETRKSYFSLIIERK